METHLKTAYRTALTLLVDFCSAPENTKKTANIAKQIANSFENKNKILICGNGGSACDAMHFAEEFTGRYRKERSALPVIHLGDPGHITCVGNDYGFDSIFSRGIEAFAQPGDWLIVLSTSGNSKNVIKAVEVAKKKDLSTLALLGKNGGKLAGKCDYEFIIPGKTADRIQEIHMLILHVLIEGVERLLFPENYQTNLTAAEKNYS